MISQRHPTVRDLLRNALPMGTRIVAGQQGLGRPVTWTSTLQTRPPAFPSLDRHELALLSMDALHLLNEKLTLTDIINDLAAMDVGAIGVLGNIDSRAQQAAENHHIPLLKLPPTVALRQVEKDVVKWLAGSGAVIEQRGHEIHEQLLLLSTENQGMATLIEALVEATGYTIVVQDKRLDSLAMAGSLLASPPWAAIEQRIADVETLPISLRDRVEVAQVTPDPILIELPDFHVQRLVMPIVANRMGRGFFSMFATDEHPFDALDYQYVRHGAAVCAIEMAKEKAVREAQKRVQGSLLERLLLGTEPISQALRQLQRLGHQPDEYSYAALAATCEMGQSRSPSVRRLESMFNEQVSALHSNSMVQTLDQLVVVFCPVDAPAANINDKATTTTKAMPRTAQQLALSMLERLAVDYPAAKLMVGVGRPVRTLSEWRTSYQEAQAALHIAQQWHISQPLYFADLGVYRLLSLLLETPELDNFYRETLGELADERYANDELMTTLDAFFTTHGNLSQTASKLHIHRNTLLYRMERIEQIGSFSLDNPETRLAVFLALKIRRLLTKDAK